MQALFPLFLFQIFEIIIAMREKAFIETRKQHEKESAEDYTELVYDLIEEKGEARICDIARNLGVSHVTAIRTIKRLETQELLNTSPQKPVTLTPKGKRLAKKCKTRHQILFEYLLALGVSEEVAAIDVEGMEHHIHPETLKAFQKHLVDL